MSEAIYSPTCNVTPVHYQQTRQPFWLDGKKSLKCVCADCYLLFASFIQLQHILALLSSLVLSSPPPLLQIQTYMPVHHSPQAVWLCGVGLHLLQLHYSRSGEAQDTTGQLGKFLWNMSLCWEAPVCSLFVIASCVLQNKLMNVHYLKGAAGKSLLPLIVPSLLSV